MGGKRVVAVVVVVVVSKEREKDTDELTFLFFISLPSLPPSTSSPLLLRRLPFSMMQSFLLPSCPLPPPPLRLSVSRYVQQLSFFRDERERIEELG